MKRRVSIRRLITIPFIAGLMALPLSAAGEGMDMTVVDGAVERELVRELSDVRSSLEALNATVPDRLSPEAVEAIEHADTPEGRREAYIDNAISMIGDPLLEETLSLVGGLKSADMLITGDSSGLSELSLTWLLSSPVLPEIPEVPEGRCESRLDLRFDMTVPVYLRGAEDNVFGHYIDPSVRSAIFGGFTAGYSWDFSMWGGIGIEAGAKVGKADWNGGIHWMVPVIAGYTFLPYIDGSRISLPITLSGGFYIYGENTDLLFSGPMADIRMAIAVDITDSFSIEVGTAFSFLFAFEDGDVSTMVLFSPATLAFGIGL